MGSILVWDPGGAFVREWKDVVHETHGAYTMLGIKHFARGGR